jgi:threonine/homoserine/homoserine lactone efflux protein
MTREQNTPKMTTRALRNVVVVAVVVFVIEAALTIWTAFDNDSSTLSLIIRVVMMAGLGLLVWTSVRNWRRQRDADESRGEPPATGPR